MTKTLAALSIALLLPAAALAAKPKPKPKPRATATPRPVDTAPATTSGERVLTDGTATAKVGTKELKFDKVTGSIQTSGGFQLASVKFEGKKDGFPKLELDFMYQGTGPLDPQWITNVFAIDEDRTITAMRPHVTTCAITLAKATPNMVEGTASCPKGMFNEEKPGKPVTDVTFHAEVK